MTRSLYLPFLLTIAAALGCGETTPPTISQLTFDRPVDIAFACYGGMRVTNGADANPAQEIITTAMPTFGCEARTGPPVVKPIGCQAKDPDPPPPPLPQPRLKRKTDLATAPGQEILYDLTDVMQDGNCGVVSQASPPQGYALVLESGPGTVHVVKFGIQEPSTSPDLDAVAIDSDPLNPGRNGISVGEEPIAIATDPAGCHAVIANAGSCDLSILDLNTALDEERGAKVDRIDVKNASGVLIDARPAALVGQPSVFAVGNVCPAAPTGLVYVAYPGCHLVAGVDPSTGTVVTGIQYDAAGVPSIVGGDVTCPSECDGGSVVTPGIRPVALDLELDPRAGSRRLVIGADNSASITVVELDGMGRPLSLESIALEDPTGTLGVSALALSPEIGMGGGSIGTFDFVNDVVADSVFQFVYAIATDGTVRVVDVLDVRQECDTQVDPRFARTGLTASDLSCLPVGASITPSRRAGARSPGIHLPGTAIPLSVEFVKVDQIKFPPALDPGVDYDPLLVTENRQGNPDKPATLIGYFAFVTASNGSTYVVNVDDDDYPDLFDPSNPLAVQVPIAIAHQLRDDRGARHLTIDDEDAAYKTPEPDKPTQDGGEDDKNCEYPGPINGTLASASPRLSFIQRDALPGTIADEKLEQLPGLRQILCDRRARHGGDLDRIKDAKDLMPISDLAYAAPPASRFQGFPDLMAVPESETWQLVWEGSLSLNTGASDVDGPAVREGMVKSDSLGLHVLDDTRPFCEAGVEPFDILKLRGCDPTTGSADCPSGHTCFVHPESKIQGLGTCMLADEADRLANACKDFLTSIRNYTVKTTTSGEIVAIPRRVELSTTPLDGCDSDDQCEALADYAVRLEGKDHPFQLTTQDPGRWSCVADPLRAPKGGTGKRCELRCDTTDNCYGGTVCQGAVAGQPLSGFCMEGVLPPQACINSSQRYQLHAGEAFAVIGQSTGFVHPIIENAAGQCVRDPMASRLSIGRLPLAPHAPGAPDTLLACDPSADPVTGQLSNGTFEPNPCITTVSHTEGVPQYMGTCERMLDANGNPVSVIVERQASAVRFRNRQMSFTLVDPTYPGDRTCIGDRMGPANLGVLDQVPHVAQGYELTLRQIGGFAPMKVLELGGDARPSLPVKILRGFANSIWVVDEGDFLSSSASPSLRGKILRLEPLVPVGSGTAIR